jgi:glycosyltransferase involved in cell wall biosynthesis
MSRSSKLLELCFICPEYPPGPHGGIGTMTQVLARALVARGHGVRVLGVYRRDYPAPDYEVDQGVRVWRRRAHPYRLGWVADRYQLFRVVASWSRRREIDLVEVPDCGGLAAGWPRLPVPVITRLHGSGTYFFTETGRPTRRATFWIEHAALNRADAWSTVSRYIAERTRRLFGLPRGPGALLYNPVEQRFEARPLAESRDVVFAGALTAKKGIISLVRAWSRVVEACRGARLHVFGRDVAAPGGGSTQAAPDGGCMLTYLRGQLDDETAKTVLFHGHVAREELFRAYRGARLAVFPSQAEGFGIAPLEAMACGCPVIYTRRGPGPELIRDDRDGLLVDPDRPEEIGAAIVRLLADDQAAMRLGQAGQARARDDFSLQTLVPQNEAFYASCLDRWKGHGSGGCRGGEVTWV